jgi:hypothetical protein
VVWRKETERYASELVKIAPAVETFPAIGVLLKLGVASFRDVNSHCKNFEGDSWGEASTLDEFYLWFSGIRLSLAF